MVLRASKYVAYVWVDLYAYDLSVVGVADVDMCVYLCAYRSFKSDEHCVGIGVIHRTEI